MILINNEKLIVEKFPDNTQRIFSFNKEILTIDKDINIRWKYQSDEELFTLICITRHIREHSIKGHKINLYIEYVPNGRMDRVHSVNEVFTLKYFCEIINSLNFNKVFVSDPHSIVTEELINNIVIISPNDFIKETLLRMKENCNDEKEIIIYFPDDGAYKRYKDLSCFQNYVCIYGKKERKWDTGEIIGLHIIDEYGNILKDKTLSDKNVLMIDDIISYGGTLAYSADKLKALGAKNICAYATHVENSILDEKKGTLLKRINDNTVRTIYTTNSIYNGFNMNINIIHYF